MATSKFVAYYRVSTKRQGESGLGLDAQKEAVRSYLAHRRTPLIAEFTEVETGTSKRRRPSLEQALSLCRIHTDTKKKSSR